jgi:phosphoribosyl-ATP pyrophosphohydrolase
MTEDGRILDRLFATLSARRGADPASSYTARLLAAGSERVAQKLGEEAIETVIAAVSCDREAVLAESADLLYHLLVLWTERGISPAEVWAELKRREGVSGVAEKAGRGKQS